MSIHKRIRKSGVRYVVVVYLPNGKQMSKTFKRKVDAEKFCDEWIKEYAEHNKTASSVKRDKQIIKNQIDPYLGRLRLNEITQKSIETWKHNLHKENGLAPKTCNNCLTLLSKILSDACRWRYLQVNEAQHVRCFRIQKSEPAFWLEEDASMFMNLIRNKYPEYQTVFSLALYAGLRKGEIRGLMWDAVDFSRRLLSVKRIFCETENRVILRTKGKKDRIVPINKALYQALKNEREARKGDLVAPVFDWLHPHRLMERLCREAGVKNKIS